MGKILFIFGLILMTAIICVNINTIKQVLDGTRRSKRTLKISNLALELSMMMFVVGTIDTPSIINFGEFSGTYRLMGNACAATAVLWFISKKKKSPLFLFAAKAILVASFFELTLFNVSSYRLWFKDYPEVTIKAEDIFIEGGATYNEQEDCIKVSDGSEGVMSFGYFKMPVGTVHADVSFPDSTKGADMVLDIKDDSQSQYYRYDISNDMVVKGRTRSQYIDCQFTGDVTEMRLKITPLNGGEISVNSVTFNENIPVVVNWYRVLLIIAASCLIFAVMNCVSMQKPIGENKAFFRNATLYITIGFCLLALLMANRRLDGKTWKEVFTDVKGNQVTHELVDAFEHGRTNIEFEENGDPLSSMTNPYDRNARDTAITEYRERTGEAIPNIWDHVYYNGKYYSYYGIAPVILLFMPYHMITGNYFPDMPAVLLFSMIGMIGLAMMFSEFSKRLFPKLPTGIYVLSLITIQIVSGIWFSMGRPDFYENAIASGFAFETWGLYFMVSANLFGKDKLSIPRTVIGSVLMSIAVLCRPTLVLYCICAAVFIICAAPRMSDKTLPNGKPKFFTKSSVKFMVLAILPMAVIGSVQMAYNFARFENPFEFGIQYSLTINDFTRAQFHGKLSWIALYNYFFNPPVISSLYPIISTNFQYLGVNGFFYSDYDATYNTSGLFFLGLPMFAYCFAGRALRTIPDSRAKLARAASIAVPCLIIPFAIVFSVWESGYAVRYMADFSWQSLTGAFTIIFYLVCRNEDQSKRNIAKALMCFACLWAVIIGGVQILNQTFRFAQYHKDFPEIAYMIENTFAFWK